MIATINAVSLIGAVPILVDVEAETLCMDLEKAQAKITPKTKAIIYVSYNGRFGDVFKVKAFCRSFNLAYVEDNAQAMFSQYANESYIGAAADVASYSFSSPKIITTGQGGCLMTNNKEVSERIAKLKDFGRVPGELDSHSAFGINSKFTDLQAIVGLSQLQNIDYRITHKKLIYHSYRKRLDSLVRFITTNLSTTIPWFVDVYVDNREGLTQHLRQNNIPFRKVYQPINEQSFINDRGFYETSRFYSNRGVWLPSSLQLTIDDVEHVCDIIERFYK
jgi:perosamine synthetase